MIGACHLYLNGARIAASALYISFVHPVYASGMKPEVAAVIVEERKGEVTVKVTNTDSTPALLYTNVQDVAPTPDHPALIIVTPPVARVEGGEIQLVRIILQTSQPLKTEQYRRITFEGIPPRAPKEDVQVGFHVRQNLPLVIRPKGLAPNSAPWKLLRWSVNNEGQLQVHNPSPYVVRLSNTVHMQPNAEIRTLPNTYLLPGEKITLPEPLPAAGKHVKHIKIDPVDDHGLPVKGGYTTPLA